MEALIMGIATAFNILVLFKKAELHRYADAFCDGALLVLLSLVFGNTLGGMMVATVASAVISVYFMYNPPNITKIIDLEVLDSDDDDDDSIDDSSYINTTPVITKVRTIKPINLKGL